MSKLILFIFVLIALIVGFAYMLNNTQRSNGPLLVLVTHAPYSLDPMEYDYAAHHFTFRSVYSSLVTLYADGIKPIIAESWSVKNDGQEWRFKIKEGLVFTDGSPINANAVYESIKRSIYHLNTKKSFSPLTENLIGFENLNSLSSEIDGLKKTENEIIFVYSKKNSNVLDALSFGHFAIMPSSCWDSKGTWLTNKSCPTSGPYKIESWDEERINLVLRDDFPPELTSGAAPHSIQIDFAESKKSYDLIVGSSNLSAKNKHFSGPVVSGIIFLRIFPYLLRDSIFSELAVRATFRDEFYSKLANYLTPKQHFLPDALTKNTKFTSSLKDITKLSKIKKIRYRALSHVDPAIRAGEAAILDFCKTHNIECEKVNISGKELIEALDAHKFSYPIDVGFITTSILVEQPLNDIKFMIDSTEGIRLPDLNGKIKNELLKPNPNLDNINLAIWDDAAVITVAHFALGFWHNHKISTKKYNRNAHPIDFSWLVVSD